MVPFKMWAFQSQSGNREADGRHKRCGSPTNATEKERNGWFLMHSFNAKGMDGRSFSRGWSVSTVCGCAHFRLVFVACSAPF